jgi:hypothetical protein
MALAVLQARGLVRLASNLRTLEVLVVAGNSGYEPNVRYLMTLTGAHGVQSGAIQGHRRCPTSAHGLAAAPASNFDGSGLVMKKRFTSSPIIRSVALKRVKPRPSSSVSSVPSSAQL